MKFPHCSYIFFGITLSLLNLSTNKRGKTWPQGGGGMATRGSHGNLAPSVAIPLGGGGKQAYLKQMI